MLGGIKKAYYTMTTTTKNRDYYLEVLATPCYLLRMRLKEDYEHYASYGFNTLDLISIVADHLTAYNEIAMTRCFWHLRDFEHNN